MSEQTKIEWADSTLNFWSGCTKVSAGCAHCYAETLSNRKLTNKAGELNIGQWGKGAPRKLHESAFKDAFRLNKKPLICDHCGIAHNIEQAHWCKPINDVRAGDDLSYHRRRVFSLSLGDWLDPEVPIEWLARMLDTIRQCDQVQWLLVTKRPELFHDRINAVLDMPTFRDEAGLHSVSKQAAGWLCDWLDGRPPQGVMVLTSVENQKAADEHIPALLKIPAAQRGLSCEPLLGPVDFAQAYPCGYYCSEEHGHVDHPFISKGSTGIDWVIVGGESGPGARTFNLSWAQSLIQQCQAAGVACFVKQLGAKPFCDNANMFDWIEDAQLVSDGTAFAACRPIFNSPKGGDILEWPLELRVREFPEVV